MATEEQLFPLAEAFGDTELLCGCIAGRLFSIAESLFHTAAKRGNVEETCGYT